MVHHLTSVGRTEPRVRKEVKKTIRFPGYPNEQCLCRPTLVPRRMRIVLWAALVCSGNALLATLHRSAPLLRSPYPVAPRHASPLGEASVTSIPYEDLTIGVIKEDKPLEKRVAQSPDSVALLVKAKFKVVVEKGAGVASEFSDDQYEAVGATIVSSDEAWKSDIVIKINPPSSSEAKLVGDRTLISQINPAKNAALLTQFEQQGSTVFALDCIPRMLSRGQTFDTLSSQTNIAGYRAVIEASRRVSLASRLPPTELPTVPLPRRRRPIPSAASSPAR